MWGWFEQMDGEEMLIFARGLTVVEMLISFRCSSPFFFVWLRMKSCVRSLNSFTVLTFFFFFSPTGCYLTVVCSLSSSPFLFAHLPFFFPILCLINWLSSDPICGKEEFFLPFGDDLIRGKCLSKDVFFIHANHINASFWLILQRNVFSNRWSYFV